MPARAETDDLADRLRLADFLPFQLSVLTNTISRRIADRYQQEFGLSIWQWRVMAVLGETPRLTATEVVERTAMDKTAVSRAVAGLVEAGHVRRVAVQEDGRRSLLSLSPKGRAVYDRIVPLALAYERELTQAVSVEDLSRLKSLLKAFADTVSPDRRLW